MLTWVVNWKHKGRAGRSELRVSDSDLKSVLNALRLSDVEAVSFDLEPGWDSIQGAHEEAARLSVARDKEEK